MTEVMVKKTGLAIFPKIINDETMNLRKIHTVLFLVKIRKKLRILQAVKTSGGISRMM
jgi:hypothetical protein